MMDPESVLDLKIEDYISNTKDAQIFKKLIAATYSTGEVTTMLLPLRFNNKIHVLRVCLNRHGPDHLIMIIPSSIYIRPNPVD